jgi:hypothetical protein
MRSQPPISTSPSCGWLKGRQSLWAWPSQCSSLHFSSFRSSSGGWSRYQWIQSYLARHVGQRQLGAVGVQARAEVDHAGVEQLGELGVLAVAGDQLVQPVQAGGAGRQLRGVDVAVDPEAGLVQVGARGAVGDDREPHLAPFMARPMARISTRSGRAAAYACSSRVSSPWR